MINISVSRAVERSLVFSGSTHPAPGGHCGYCGRCGRCGRCGGHCSPGHRPGKCSQVPPVASRVPRAPDFSLSRNTARGRGTGHGTGDTGNADRRSCAESRSLRPPSPDYLPHSAIVNHLPHIYPVSFVPFFLCFSATMKP